MNSHASSDARRTLLQRTPLVLSENAEEVFVGDGVHVYKTPGGSGHLTVGKEQLEILNRFRRPLSVPNLIPDLIAERCCPPLREVYELICQALHEGILKPLGEETEGKDVRQSNARPVTQRLSPVFGEAAALVFIFLGVAMIFSTPLEQPSSLLWLIAGYVLACVALAISNLFGCWLLRGMGFPAFCSGLRMRIPFLETSCDFSAVCQGSRRQRSAFFFVRLAPVFLIAGMVSWFLPDAKLMLLLALFQVTQPHPDFPGWQLLRALLRPLKRSTLERRFFSSRESFRERLNRIFEQVDFGWTMVGSAYVVTWTFLLVSTVASGFGMSPEVAAVGSAQFGGLPYLVWLLGGGTALLSILALVRVALAGREPVSEVDLEKQVHELRDLGPNVKPPVAEVAKFLRNSLLLKNAHDSVVAKVAERVEVQHFRRGSVIYSQGEKGGDLHFIGRGKVEMLMRMKSGKQMRISSMEAGEVFGENAAFYGSAHTRTVRAVTAVRCLVLSEADFHELLIDKLGAREVKDMVEKQYFMRHTQMRHGWNGETVMRFSKIATFAHYKAGEKIVRKGTSHPFFFIVFDGELEARRADSSVHLTNGDYYGEVSLLRGEPFDADLVATTDTRCLLVKRRDFLSMIGEDYDFGLQMEAETAKKIKGPVFPLDGVLYSDMHVR